MKKILVVGMTDNYGGIESVIMSYYRAIDKTRFQCVFLANTPVMAYEDEIAQLGGIVIHVPARHQHPVEFYRSVHTFFRNHAHEYSAIWFNCCSLANISYLSFAKRYGIAKRIVHCHNAQNGEGKLRGVLHALNRRRVRGVATDFWSCSNEASVWFYGDDFKNLTEYKFIPNTIDPNKFAYSSTTRRETRHELGVADTSIVIGNVARLEPQKNPAGLVRIFSELHKVDPRYQLFLIGKGELEEGIRSYVGEHGLRDDVHFLGIRHDIADLYQAMDMFMLPSLFEGFPVTLLEAQDNGLPTVLSSTITEEIDINDNLLRIDIKDAPRKIARSINAWYKLLPARRVIDNRVPESKYSISMQIRDFEASLSE
ncbi:glycosyltransferase [Bifidobacterium mongoliense]|uniref:glycosyltransferase n=1 Tax=Bifidobacterium mongoliense TaxID=518643 RepID=UPI0030EB6B91